MITTTLTRIRAHRPCKEGWEKLLVGLGKVAADDEPLPYAQILRINGLDDALWCCRAEPQHAREWRLFAVWCARQVQHLVGDPRCLAALDVAERYAEGLATSRELTAAWAAAWDVAGGAAWAAVGGATGDVAGDAAGGASWDAAGAAAWAAARDAARAAAWGAAKSSQAEHFLEVVGRVDTCT